ncbi:MAG: hypothetical protein L3K04_05135 [Thermoplasmata archaeon]|nr:hypothetical protein [Thermoplasmata archaeon]
MPPTSTGSSSPREPAGGAPPRAPARPSEIADRLERLGVRPSRSSGQSFLCDPFAADIEVALLELPAGTGVTEIGGGLGLLTEALLRRGISPLRVLERDRRLARHLRGLFGDRVRVEEVDAREYDFPPGEGVIGNLPFSSASVILQRLFPRRPPRVVALVQQEVGERLAASPGGSAFGRPTIQAQLYGSVEQFATVPAHSFYPVPAVDAVTIRFTPRAGTLPVDSPARLEELVRHIFAWRRKQLGRTLANQLGGAARAARLASAAGWEAGWEHQRPEELPPEAYFALERAVAADEPAARSAGRNG